VKGRYRIVTKTGGNSSHIPHTQAREQQLSTTREKGRASLGPPVGQKKRGCPVAGYEQEKNTLVCPTRERDHIYPRRTGR